VVFSKAALVGRDLGSAGGCAGQTPTTADLLRQRSSRSPRDHAGRRLAGVKAAYELDTPFNVTTLQWKGAGGLTASVANFQMHNRGHGSAAQSNRGCT